MDTILRIFCIHKILKPQFLHTDIFHHCRGCCIQYIKKYIPFPTIKVDAVSNSRWVFYFWQLRQCFHIVETLMPFPLIWSVRTNPPHPRNCRVHPQTKRFSSLFSVTIALPLPARNQWCCCKKMSTHPTSSQTQRAFAKRHWTHTFQHWIARPCISTEGFEWI